MLTRKQADAERMFDRCNSIEAGGQAGMARSLVDPAGKSVAATDDRSTIFPAPGTGRISSRAATG